MRSPWKRRVAAASALVLAIGAAGACDDDNEDEVDTEEIEEDVEDFGDEVEDQIDEGPEEPGEGDQN